MKITVHEDHVRILKERAEQQRKDTDILLRYTPAQLTDILAVDLYFLLNVQEYRRIPIPSNVLFLRYRERIVRYHPNYHDDRVFMAIRNGYEILKSTFWKKKYDDYFVDEICVEDKNYGAEFYEFFDRYFENMRVFAKGEAPLLGDPGTPLEQVERFYAFWKNFESTRSFDFVAYHPEYEKMSSFERSNHDSKYRKEKKTLFNQHVIEVRSSAAVCQRNDPRIKREKIFVDPSLVCNGWSENDVVLLKRLTKKYRAGNIVDWKRVVRDFKMENGARKSMKDLLVKNTQIERLCK